VNDNHNIIQALDQIAQLLVQIEANTAGDKGSFFRPAESLGDKLDMIANKLDNLR